MSYYSGFSSNFASNIVNNSDILSNISETGTIEDKTYSSYNLKGRYFVLGDLLIQFVDMSASTYHSIPTGTIKYNFQKEYNSNPYYISACGYNNDGNTTDVTIDSFNTSSVTFKIATSTGCLSFMVIGPRPSTM